MNCSVKKAVCVKIGKIFRTAKKKTAVGGRNVFFLNYYLI